MVLFKHFNLAIFLLLICSSVCAKTTARFSSLSIEDGLPSKSVRVIAQDNQGFIWFGTVDGLARYDGYEVRSYSAQSKDLKALSGNSIRAIAATEDNALWIATNGNGLNRFDPKTENFQTFRHNPENPISLSSNQINALASDHKGNLWVGTSKGLDSIDIGNHEIQHFRNQADNKSSLPDNKVSVLLHTRSGKLWIATAKGIRVYDTSTEKFNAIDFDSKLAVYALHESQDGRIWIGTNAGLFFYDLNNQTTQAYVNHKKVEFFKDKSIYAINSDLNGNLWVGGRYMGLCQVNSRNRVSCHQYDKGTASSIRDNTILSITRDTSEQLWIGTYRGGAQKLDLPSLSLGLDDTGSERGLSCQKHQGSECNFRRE